ncbi:MAG: NAD-dependent epimerase/dehydratase family protein [Ignavibacteriaceae bacterium]
MITKDLPNSLFTNKFWQGRRVLVTGAFGFVGTWLMRNLASQDSNVFAFVLPEHFSRLSPEFVGNPNIQLLPGNVNDYSSTENTILSLNIDSIFHLAAVNTNFKLDSSPKSLFDTNIRGTYNVLESALIASTVKRIVIASSREVEDCQQTNEEDVYRRPIRRPYQVSKISAELIAQAYHDTYGLPVTVARCSNIYGGGDLNWNRLIPSSIRQILSDTPPKIRSDGKLKRDYIYIEDIIRAYLMLGDMAGDEGVSGGIFSFGTGKLFSVLDVVGKIATLAGKTELRPIILNESNDERVDESYTFEREEKILGWTSRIDIEVGLSQTLDWYKSYFGC